MALDAPTWKEPPESLARAASAGPRREAGVVGRTGLNSGSKLAWGDLGTGERRWGLPSLLSGAPLVGMGGTLLIPHLQSWENLTPLCF